MTNNTPTEVPSYFIDHLKAKEEEGYVPLKTIFCFLKGEEGVIKDGPFQGQVGSFEQYTDQDRVEILLKFLGKEVKISISESSFDRS